MPPKSPSLTKQQAAYMAMLEADAAVNPATDSFLRACGWDRRCDYPGALWLWSKTLPDGRVLALNSSAAVHVEQAINDELAGEFLD